MGGSSYSNVDCDEVSGSVTPSSILLKSELQSLNTDLPPSSDGDNSSVASMNEGCESPLSSWDSEPETDIPSFINCDGMPEGSLQSINLEENYLEMEEQKQFVGVENSDDGSLWEMDNRSYDDLLKKFMEKEDELRFSNFRVQLLELENIDLKVQVENSEGQLDNVSKELKLKEEELLKEKELSEEAIFNLKIQIENQLNNVNEELKLKEEELKTQDELLKEKILKLKIHFAKSETQRNMVNQELKALNKQKQLSDEEIFKLKTQIEKNEIQLNNVNKELKLKEEELNVQKELSEEQIFNLKIRIENRLNNVNEELKLKEEELNVQKKLSEEEISKLKTQIVKSEFQLNNVNEELKLKEKELNKQKELSEEEILKLKTQIKETEIQLYSMKELWKLKEEELNVQKELLEEEIFKLKIQIEKSENQLDITVQEQFNLKQLDAALENLKISNDEVAFSRMELENKSSEINLLQDQLKVTQENMAKLELELVSEKQQNQMLGDWVEMYEANETNQEQEVRKLKLELFDSQAKFCLEKDELKRELTSKLEDCDSRNKELENKLSQYKLKEEELHASQQKFFEDEIESLMEEHGQRMDMLMIELEKANNMIDYLKTEICSRDDKISNMKKYTDDVKTSLKELMVEYNTALNEVNNLKLRVGELENEVTRQNGVITDMAEEKKEAIRQLCSSLEHSKSKLEYYKSGYNELLQTLYG
ncbi:hypothetical protein P8452_22591 [Trifolium repens]|nr:hypothetical protein P8452_22591 [Trifolium repens]